MKIGAVEINLEELPLDELRQIADEIVDVYCRREKEQELKNKMTDLVTEAEAAGFKFVTPGLLLGKANFGIAKEVG